MACASTRHSCHESENILAHFDLNEALARALKTERVVNLQLSQKFALARETNAILDFDQDQIGIVRRPWKEVKAYLDALPRGTGFWSGTPLLNHLVLGIAKVHIVKDRTLALINSLRALNALSVHSEEGSTGLTRLDLPADALVDPFNGNRLHVKTTSAGFVVYSVGENQIDDGGDITGKNCKDVGLALTRLRSKNRRTGQ